jgi:hypothetical protein
MNARFMLAQSSAGLPSQAILPARFAEAEKEKV